MYSVSSLFHSCNVYLMKLNHYAMMRIAVGSKHPKETWVRPKQARVGI